MMEMKKYKLGDLLDIKRGTSLSGEYYSTEGDYVRLTCGNFDYTNNSFKENTSKVLNQQNHHLSLELA